uniref:Uncharacterized protein n=1 Tax=Schistocephalus solidus TaxID=70667 RepID=A0A0V0J9Q8_SCHSO
MAPKIAHVGESSGKMSIREKALVHGTQVSAGLFLSEMWLTQPAASCRFKVLEKVTLLHLTVRLSSSTRSTVCSTAWWCRNSELCVNQILVRVNLCCIYRTLSPYPTWARCHYLVKKTGGWRGSRRLGRPEPPLSISPHLARVSRSQFHRGNIEKEPLQPDSQSTSRPLHNTTYSGLSLMSELCRQLVTL